MNVNAEARKAARRGARRLDRYIPNWYRKIKPEDIQPDTEQHMLYRFMLVMGEGTIFTHGAVAPPEVYLHGGAAAVEEFRKTLAAAWRWQIARRRRDDKLVAEGWKIADIPPPRCSD